MKTLLIFEDKRVGTRELVRILPLAELKVSPAEKLVGKNT